MKRKIIFSASFLLLSFLSVNNSFGQMYAGVTTVSNADVAPILSLETTSTVSNVSPQLAKVFAEKFGNVANVKWVMGTPSSSAYFTKDDETVRAVYDNRNRLSYTITNYAATNKLPKNVIAAVRQSYPHQSIFGITEVTVGQTTAYMLVLEDAYHFEYIKYLNGEINTEKVLNKE